MKVKVPFETVEVEANAKVASMLEYSDRVEKLLVEECEKHFSKAELARIEATIFFARSLESTNAHHPSMLKYFSHPLRVAKISLQILDQPSAEIVSMGLLHNVFEVTDLTETDLLEAGYSERLASGIRLTTINRERQYDESYLKKFYGRIKEFGDDLALIKCVDKLDNLLAFELFERTPDIERYMTLCEQFVVPLAGSLSANFGAYVQQTINYMRTAGCNEELRSRYQQFLTETEEIAT